MIDILPVVMLVSVFNGAGIKIDTIEYETKTSGMKSCMKVASNSMMQLNDFFKDKNYTVIVECKEK